MKESFQATVVDVATGTLNLVPFSFDYDLTPRVWLGYFGENGMGVRASYWQYDHNADSLTLSCDAHNVSRCHFGLGDLSGSDFYRRAGRYPERRQRPGGAYRRH